MSLVKEDTATNEDKDKEPEIVNKPAEIKTKMADHFQGIFNKQEVDKTPNCIVDFLLADNDQQPYEKLLCRQLSEELKQELEGLLTLNELEEALFKDMKPNSDPGLDGFTVKFLRTFWPVLAPLITAAINEMKIKGKLTTTLRTAIIKLFQKTKKDPTNPNSLRPISLLSVILYKFLQCLFVCLSVCLFVTFLLPW